MCFFNENECSKNFYSDTKFVYNNYLKSLPASGGSIFFSFIIFKISVLYKTLVGDLKILYLSNQQIKNIHYEKS